MHTVIQGLFWGSEHLAKPLAGTFLTLGSSLSIPSLYSALAIAIGVMILRRKGRRDLKVRVLRRALFPRRLYASASSRADAGFLFLSIFVVGGLIGWGVFSSVMISDAVRHMLTSILGERPPSPLDPNLYRIIATVILFLTIDFAYWANHYASHRIGWLWEFHKVHHTAEVLTPMTNARVHPIDSLVYSNFLSVFLGVSNGVLGYCFGSLATPFTIAGTNILVLLFAFTFLHLQHSHIWIATTGRLGKVIFSPAHHQIHHSAASIHFDKNFGACFAVWDWMFGTLYQPAPKRERLIYGVAPDGTDPHSIKGALLMPFIHAASRILQPLRQRRAAAELEAVTR
jgi:sterol desaturase/sphingolipid hydroxylase (fatty acid hydroxylase superfamily)